MRTQFCQAIATVALVVASGTLTAGTAAGQAVIVQDPVETRTIVRERMPLALTPAQRTTIYRTIVPQGRGKQPIVRERVVTETMGSSAPVRERVVTEPVLGDRVVINPPIRERVVDPLVRDRIVVDPVARERVVVAPTEVDYVVGDRVPASVSLNPFPERIIRQVPATSAYRYMVVNDRLLLVDPATSTVVEEIVR
jgi:hypothetical protein